MPCWMHATRRDVNAVCHIAHDESGSAYPAGGKRPRTAGKEYTESESQSVVFAHFVLA
jgi:hypothetical protein